MTEPQPLTADELAFDVLRAGVARAGDVPVLIVNEPIFIADGANSDVRYNAFYPRWAYDAYRDLLIEVAAVEGWALLDVWNLLPQEAFTDSPVHITAEGVQALAEAILVQMPLP
ncbi:hypothetical protein HC928_13845 [bacterium]|nr:hypothetical protein [bacterium]